MKDKNKPNVNLKNANVKFPFWNVKSNVSSTEKNSNQANKK